MPIPERMNGGDELRVRRPSASRPPRSSRARSPAARARCAISGRPPMRSESAPAIGATKIGIAVHGRMRRPGLQRRVALHGLEELREQEDRAEHPEEHEAARRRSPPRRSGCGRSASAASAPARAAPRATNATSSERAERSSEPTISGLAQPDRVPADEAPDDPEQAGAREGEAGEVEPRRRAVASPSGAAARAGSGRARSARSARRSTARRCPRRRRRRRAGRARRRGRRSRPRRRARRPRRSGGTAALRMVSVSGSHDRAAEALDRPRGDQRLDRRRERGRGGGDGEDRRGRCTNIRRRPKRSPSAAPVRSSTAKVSV